MVMLASAMSLCISISSSLSDFIFQRQRAHVNRLSSSVLELSSISMTVVCRTVPLTWLISSSRTDMSCCSLNCRDFVHCHDFLRTIDWLHCFLELEVQSLVTQQDPSLCKIEVSQRMVLDLCSCSISSIDEIIQLNLCCHIQSNNLYYPWSCIVLWSVLKFYFLILYGIRQQRGCIP